MGDSVAERGGRERWRVINILMSKPPKRLVEASGAQSEQLGEKVGVDQADIGKSDSVLVCLDCMALLKISH